MAGFFFSFFWRVAICDVITSRLIAHLLAAVALHAFDFDQQPPGSQKTSKSYLKNYQINFIFANHLSQNGLQSHGRCVTNECANATWYSLIRSGRADDAYCKKKYTSRIFLIHNVLPSLCLSPVCDDTGAMSKLPLVKNCSCDGLSLLCYTDSLEFTHTLRMMRAVSFIGPELIPILFQCTTSFSTQTNSNFKSQQQ